MIESCRESVGDDFIVGLRLTADESNEGGIDADEGIEIARLIGRHGVSDFINVNGAYSGTFQGVNCAFPGMEAKSAPYLELARPHMADPHIVAKLLDGREDRIRPCVGAGYCLDRPYRGLDALCLHNPSTGRESRLPHGTDPATAQYLAGNGAELIIGTPDRIVGSDIGAQNLPVFMRSLLGLGARFLTDVYLTEVRRANGRLIVRCRNRYTRTCEEIPVDTVILDQGVVSDRALFDALSPGSRNLGEYDLIALAAGKAQPDRVNPGGLSVVSYRRCADVQKRTRGDT